MLLPLLSEPLKLTEVNPRDPHIPLEECEDGVVYRLSSCNLAIGMWVARVKRFAGLREKFGHWRVDYESHFGEPGGTACPMKALGILPYNVNLDTSQGEEPLRQYLAFLLGVDLELRMFSYVRQRGGRVWKRTSSMGMTADGHCSPAEVLVDGRVAATLDCMPTPKQANDLVKLFAAAPLMRKTLQELSRELKCTGCVMIDPEDEPKPDCLKCRVVKVLDEVENHQPL